MSNYSKFGADHILWESRNILHESYFVDRNFRKYKFGEKKAQKVFETCVTTDLSLQNKNLSMINCIV